MEEPISEAQNEAPDGFVVDALSAADLLGVNRTRLSQLTSKGVFPYQRRRVGTRQRLFYRRSDLQEYLSAQSRPQPPMQRQLQNRSGAQAGGGMNALSSGTREHSWETQGVDTVLGVAQSARALQAHENGAPQPNLVHMDSSGRNQHRTLQQAHPRPALPSALATRERNVQMQLLEHLLLAVEKIVEKQTLLEAELISLRRSQPLRDAHAARSQRGSVANRTLPRARAGRLV